VLVDDGADAADVVGVGVGDDQPLDRDTGLRDTVEQGVGRVRQPRVDERPVGGQVRTDSLAPVQVMS
jgi:hypothetical protein